MNAIVKEDFTLIEEICDDVLAELAGKSFYITGSYGMITTYLSWFLIDCSYRYEFDIHLQGRNLEKARRVFSEYLTANNVHLTSDDFMDHEPLRERVDYIIHAASPASTRYFKETPVDVIKPNVIGTLSLLEYARSRNAEKLLFLSSNSIYGEYDLGEKLLGEGDYGVVDPLGERSCYVESKRMAEQMCSAYARQYGVPSSIVRICHTYGPTFDVLNDNRILPRTIRSIVTGDSIEVFSDPNSFVQYTYVADIVSALLFVLARGQNGQAYNAGSDEVVTIDDAIYYLFAAAPSTKSRIIEKPVDETYNFAKGKGVNFAKLDTEKLKSLGWRPLFSAEEGFARTMRSFLPSTVFGCLC